MTLGEKIKKARKAKRITQTELAKNKITRNMISRIESDNATPSLDTIKYIASELKIPVSYFLSEEDDLFFYEKAEKIRTIYRAFKTKEYEYCINKINELSAIDNELALILTTSYFELGKENLMRGSLSSAKKCFENAKSFSEKTLFDTAHICKTLPLYTAIAENIQAPLLEFDASDYENGLADVFDYELYKYVTQDFSHKYKNTLMQKHAEAKRLIKDRNYQEAIAVMREAESIAKTESYNAFIVFSLYSDLESCYKQLYDFENAYRYSSKRISMIEGFKS